MSTTPPLSKEAEQVADFLVKIASDLYSGQGVRVGIADLGVLSAGKKINPKTDGLPIIRKAFLKMEAKHPELLDVLMIGFNEVMKEKIRRAAGAKPPIDT